jgi:hypothetical protein
MKNLVPLYIPLLCALSYGQNPNFQSVGYGLSGADYLKRPLHAQSASMSGAVVAWDDDLAGIQINPAIVDAVPIKAVVVKGSYSFLSWDRKHMGATVASCLGPYLAGRLTYISYGVSNIEGRDTFGMPTENFNYGANALAVSLAGRLKWNISVGACVRYLNEGMCSEHANGVGVDIGATWKALDIICIGVSAQNLFSRLWWTTGHSDPVLPIFRLGARGLFLKKSLQAEIDFVKRQEWPEELALGIQYTLFDIVSLRGGLTSAVDFSTRHSKTPDYSLGLGIKYSFFGFDYACLFPASDLGISHKISVNFTFK